MQAACLATSQFFYFFPIFCNKSFLGDGNKLSGRTERLRITQDRLRITQDRLRVSQDWLRNRSGWLCEFYVV